MISTMNPSSRVISLDGQWLLTTDPDNAGREGRWFDAPRPEAVPARVPWIIQDAFPAYHGVAWYWRAFAVPRLPHPDGRVLLRFWAVDYLADVWVNGIHAGGHEGGETPFELDVTDALASSAGSEALLAVRVLNPTNEPIDGVVLNETPHRNKAVPHYVGGSYNSGGITEPVELVLAPPVRLRDVYARPDPTTGVIHVQASVVNAQPGLAGGVLSFAVAPAASGETLATAVVETELRAGEQVVAGELRLGQPRLWDLSDPYLYRVTVRLDTGGASDEFSVRCGFRDFRVAGGYFRLNGRRVFVRSTHTGNHCPVGQVIAPPSAPDLLRRDLLYARASGFNMVRFIAGVAHPWQLDLCDEIGLMVYEECYAGWLLQDSPHMARRFDLSVREMILRDRNHPSVAIWGLLNETFDGPVFRHAADSLALVRSLDTTRLVLLGSGRWDCQPGIGSACNPGSTEWEHVWGAEEPGAPAVSNEWNRQIGGYFDRAGDAHAYPSVPHPPEIVRFLRTVGQDTRPVFLSEYGIGSTLNAIRELRCYEQAGVNLQAEDAVLMRSMADQLTADWERFGMAGVYAFPEDMLRDSQRLHVRQRLLGFDAIRSNPNLCGFNVTGMLDHGMTGEGLWTFWREWKPGIVDALSDGWSPLRWCLFAEPGHAYVGQPIRIEAVLANEDVLPPGDYPVRLRIIGASGVVWDRAASAHVPGVPHGEDGPLSVPVLADEVRLDAPPGEYELAANMQRGGAPAGGRLTFHLSDRTDPGGRHRRIATWGCGSRAEEWLSRQGVDCTPFDGSTGGAPVVLVGSLEGAGASDASWQALLQAVDRGCTAVFLSPLAFKQGDDTVARLPLEPKGRWYAFNDWLYHKECVARAHPVFAGLQRPGIMDWDYYGPVIPHELYTGQETPDDVAAVAFAVGYSCPGGYASGVLLGAYRFGAGRIVLNTLRILDHVGAHPAADRLLLNLVDYGASRFE